MFEPVRMLTRGSLAIRVRNLFARKSMRLWLLTAIVFLSLWGILMTDLLPSSVDLKVGQVAREDIQASKTIVNQYRTSKLEEEAAKQAVKDASQDPANFEINQAAAIEAEEDIKAFFALISEVRQGQPSGASGQAERSDEASFESAQISAVSSAPSSTSTGQPQANDSLTLQQKAEIVQQRARDEIGLDLSREAIRRILAASDEDLFTMEGESLRIAVETMSTERIFKDNLSDVKEAISVSVEQVNLPADLRASMLSLLWELVKPNMVLNPEKVERARQQAVDAVEPVMVLKDQTVIRKGEVVTEEHIQILTDLGLQRKTANYLAVFGMALLTALLLLLIGAYLWQYERHVITNEALAALLGLIILVISFLAKLFSLIPWEGSGYLIPVAFGSILIAILLDSRLAIVATVMLSTIVGIAMDYELSYALIALAGGITAVFSVSRVSQRSDLTRAGFAVGAANFFAMISLGLVTGEMFMVKNSYLGLANGLVSGVAAIGFLPYLETMFGVTSSIRLLELSNPNQPLLRKLLVEAPGTYHHSIIVGNLAEAAAEAVKGDALLARVGSHYHDIGKIKRPYFFAENQLYSDNPHDRISPSLSTLVITSHVKDGVELAKEQKLPECLVDFIRQHHGTDLVKFFFHRATENGKEAEVDEKDFRYPGPKPQSKETAIVMLADSVEAAVRSLSKPTPGRIEGLVRKIIKERLNDGQLDESDLTLKDLDKIAAAFTRVLTGIFHSRVEYPENILQELEARRLQSQ